jgi:hypothetical protein
MTEFNLPVVDCIKAFGMVERNTDSHILKLKDFSQHLIRVIQSLVLEQILSRGMEPKEVAETFIHARCTTGLPIIPHPF